MVQNYVVRRQTPRVAEQCDVNIHSLTRALDRFNVHRSRRWVFSGTGEKQGGIDYLAKSIRTPSAMDLERPEANINDVDPPFAWMTDCTRLGRLSTIF
ncbi:hypothetical protein TNCV_3751331 [Trichonephila clavipes]|uniref:Uncharacterized protein n=1 Tax=Trichonephila clavipes TaxID=2585209 RepID=A0A8X6R3H7_TRICX|nr:hypothetical protein TNCV_3751331 [Trichonephila clavipes]